MKAIIIILLGIFLFLSVNLASGIDPYYSESANKFLSAIIIAFLIFALLPHFILR
jgi:Na+/H+ antiporter NhaC